MKRSYIVESSFLNSRLDKWFRRNINDVPQSLIEKNIRKGNIKVNNSKKKSSYKLKENDKIVLYNIKFENKIENKIVNYIPSKKEIFHSSNLIIENNENFVVINKPSGIAVQSGTKSKRNIVDILRKTEEFEGHTPFLVHRIDKETTGILIVAKNRKYAQLFTSLFRIRKIHKIYLAIVIGSVEEKSGKYIDTLFHYEGKKKNEYKAISKYTVLDSRSNYSFLKLFPETGRKHQLRKQLLIRGFPIFGDSKYRFIKNKINKKQNLMLHASEIYFTINNYRYNFTADLPVYFKKFLNEKNLKNF
jgi:23S rRNA pseudouridine955/2504/2580 synthase